MKRLIICCILCATVLGCRSRSESVKDSPTVESVTPIADSVKCDSIVDSAQEKADEEHRAVEKLMGGLFNYVDSVDLYSNLRHHVVWMENFKSEVDKYYDKYCHKPLTTEPKNKTEKALNKALNLYDKQNGGGTWVYEERKFAISVFQNYHLFYQTLQNTPEDKQHALENEFSAWLKMADTYIKFMSECAELSFLGGNASSYYYSNGRYKIWRAHEILYRNETEFHLFVGSSKVLLLDSGERALIEYISDDENLEGAYGDSADYYKKLQSEHISKAKRYFNQFRPQLDSWLKTTSMYNDKMVSEMLLHWASVVSFW